MPSPLKESAPGLAAPFSHELQPPPSPRTHRALRRLQSAHSLGAKVSAAANPPSLIAQQRQQQQQQQQRLHLQQHDQLFRPQQRDNLPPRSLSPIRRDLSTSSAGAATSHRSPQRGRANSDAPVLHQLNPANAAKRSLVKKTNAAANGLSLQQLLRDGPPDGDVAGALESARVKILDSGIKSDSDGMSNLRIYAWLILLNAPVMATDDYLGLIHRGASPAYSKIRNDTFRTLTTDPLFRRRVSEASLIRLLNAVAWKLHDAREELRKDHPHSARSSLAGDDGTIRGSSQSQVSGTSPAAKNRARALTLTTEGSETSVAAEPGTYVQGMNVLAAPFLYAARSEAEAFVAFYSLLTQECPGYIRGAMDGVHKGLALVDKVLAILDPKLNSYLMDKGLSAEIYAFPSVLTLCACTPPLPEVLRLWDFLFAYGPHLNILCIVAQLWLIRKQILESASPNKLLRSFPALQSDLIKKTTLSIIKQIPEDLYAEIVAHAR